MQPHSLQKWKKRRDDEEKRSETTLGLSLTSSEKKENLQKLPTVLLGPVQSLTYALNYGWPSAALGSSWARRLPWQCALGFGVLARIAGVSGYVALTSWTLGEFF